MTRYGSQHGRIPKGRDSMIWLAHVSLVALVGYVMIVRMKVACIYSPICLKYSRCHSITSPVLLRHSDTPSLVLPIHSKPLSIAITHMRGPADHHDSTRHTDPSYIHHRDRSPCHDRSIHLSGLIAFISTPLVDPIRRICYPNTPQGERTGYPREVFFISDTPAHSSLSHYHRC